jgi:hypothetical protein
LSVAAVGQTHLESFRADKRYLMLKRMLAVLPSLTTLMM